MVMGSMVRLVGVAALAALLAACGGSPASRVQGQDPGVVHVHALARDPADASSLYVATHTGLFHIDGGGRPERVGDRYHDLMGFTAVGPDDFIASGHPDPRSPELNASGRPPLLGLVVSDDAGVSWSPLSLLGEADFHSLQSAHGMVYGYDSTSGRFMVSSDRRSWETRSSVALVDFAVSPDDPDVVVGSIGQGLIATADGGRTWEPLPEARYAVLDWARAGLFGITPEGSVAVSRDAGRTWTLRGTVGGPPEALLAADDLLAAAATDAGIVQSRDGGATWTARLPAGS